VIITILVFVLSGIIFIAMDNNNAPSTEQPASNAATVEKEKIDDSRPIEDFPRADLFLPWKDDDFHIDKTCAMCELCIESYYSDETLAAKHFSFDKTKYFHINEADCILAQKKDIIFIVFRGTDSITDWMRNLAFLSNDSKFGSGKVHRGIKSHLDNVATEVREELSSWLNSSSSTPVRLYIGGHSLGGACASLFFDRLCHVYKDDDKVKLIRGYTFGAPRVGDEEFAKSIASHAPFGVLERISCGADAVPRVPSVFMGYHHVGNERFIDFLSSEIRSDASIWEKNLDRLVTRASECILCYPLIGRFMGIYHHLIIHYKEKLLKLRKVMLKEENQKNCLDFFGGEIDSECVCKTCCGVALFCSPLGLPICLPICCTACYEGCMEADAAVVPQTEMERD
jgi:hypothetical protein